MHVSSDFFRAWQVPQNNLADTVSTHRVDFHHPSMAAAWLLAAHATAGMRVIGSRRPNSDIQVSLNIYLRARQTNDGEAITVHRTQ
jgi:hypothetical protein